MIEKVVYEMEWLIERIYWESDKLLSYVSNTERFESRCINGLAEYLTAGEGNYKNKKQLIRIINRYVKEAKEKYRKEEAELFTTLLKHDEDGEGLEFEPTDVLADVEAEIITKETAALLAQGDRRKKLVIGSWKLGKGNNSEISRLLAQSVGGNSESHRKFIQRFRTECREMLADAI